MFKNAGRKLTTLAKVIFAIMCVGGLISGISAGAAIGNEFSGGVGVIAFLIVTALGVLSAWICTIVIYAFGELCENVRAIREGMGFGQPMPAPMMPPMGQPMPQGQPMPPMPFNAGGMPPFGGQPAPMPQPAPMSAPMPMPSPVMPQGQAQQAAAPVPEQAQPEVTPALEQQAQPETAPAPEQVQQEAAPAPGQEAPVIIPMTEEVQPAPAPTPEPAPAPKPEGWKCPTCGKQNAERNVFCTGCGTVRPAETVSLEK